MSETTTISHQTILEEYRRSYNALIAESPQEVIAAVNFYLAEKPFNQLILLYPDQVEENTDFTFYDFLLLMLETVRRQRPTISVTNKLKQYLRDYADHESTRHYQVWDIVNDPDWGEEKEISGKIASALAVVLEIVVDQVKIAPICIVKMSNSLTKDEELFLKCKIIMAPSYLDDGNLNPLALSPNDLMALKSIYDQISDKTPLTARMYKEILKGMFDQH